MAPAKLRSRPVLPAKLRTVIKSATSLLRISDHKTGEPHFFFGGGRRFDHPGKVHNKHYGTCYFGESLAIAFSETVLHDILPDADGVFRVARDILMRKSVLSFASTGSDLVLADLTGAALKSMGGNAQLSGAASYRASGQWGKAIHEHPNKVDGIWFMSRHKNDEKAIVLFDRARDKLKMKSAFPLIRHSAFAETMKAFNVMAT